MKRIVVIAALLASSACGTETDDRPPTLAYVTEAILAPTCGKAECHSSFTQEVGDVFDTVSATRKTIVPYAMVVYTDTPTDAYLVQTITVGAPSVQGGNVNDLIRMPYDAPMPDYDINLIKAWIATGAPGGSGPVGAQCVPGPADDSTQGCNLLGKLVECDEGTEGAIITDCAAMSMQCLEGACAPL